MNDKEVLLRLDNIRKEYGVPGTANRRTVLSKLSLIVNRGESIAVIGPSGSGKTTLLNLIAALDKPDAGLVEFNGRDLAKLTANELDTYRNRSIGQIFQLHHLLPQCTLLENILIPTLARPDKTKRLFYRERAEGLVKRMGLWEMRNQYPGQLSGGECQRTAIARALIIDPDLLLADEPTGALDEANAANLIELLTEINKLDGKTIILVTHSAELAGRMGRVLELKDGKI
ncbi:MAG: ABC transporter ATP-binding protein [Porphyromonadaceae bacterium]|nr:MAG: ABC transporter ATP-binding protein [Porphyromonadaceae bacterium]